ncbi:MAG: hypothetical protein WDM89_03500 [Rhizomicrobium sp.]
MTVDRVANNSQASYLLSQIMQATKNLNTSAGAGRERKSLVRYTPVSAKRLALSRPHAPAPPAPDAYQSNTQSALNQVNLQDTQMTQLSSVAQQLQQALTSAVGNNDATGLMDNVQSIFDQVSQILNAKDSNGNYLFGGDNDNTPPFNVTSLSQLASLTNISDAFSNGTQKKSVMVGDGQSEQIGILASDIGTQIMQTLKDIATFNAGSTGNMSGQFTDAQVDIPVWRNSCVAERRAKPQHRDSRERLYLQPPERRGRSADRAFDALQGLRVQHRRRRHANGHHAVEPEPDRPSGRLAGDVATGPDFSAELPAEQLVPCRFACGARPGGL